MRNGGFGAALGAALLAALAMAPAGAQDRPAVRPGSGELWFDPTQLPSFTGTVERFLVNPRGEVDALLFREGPQVSFPPDVAEGVRRVAAQGRPLIVWGIRARNAPVITMLAYAPNAETTPVVADRFYWRLSGRGGVDGAERLAIYGTVKTPYYTPQGEVAGAVLEDGAVVLLPRSGIEPFRELLRAGQWIAAEGTGYQGDAGRAILADRLGERADAMRPVPQPDPSAPAPTPPRSR